MLFIKNFIWPNIIPVSPGAAPNEIFYIALVTSSLLISILSFIIIKFSFLKLIKFHSICYLFPSLFISYLVKYFWCSLCNVSNSIFLYPFWYISMYFNALPQLLSPITYYSILFASYFSYFNLSFISFWDGIITGVLNKCNYFSNILNISFGYIFYQFYIYSIICK